MSQQIIRSLLDDPPDKPYCPVCGDFFYVRQGDKARVCPCCSCPRCSRLVGVHPDLGGCTCHEALLTPPELEAKLMRANPAIIRRVVEGQWLPDIQKRG